MIIQSWLETVKLKVIAVSFLLLMVTEFCNAQRNIHRYVFYNVENLFDTIDAPNKNDNEFTPDSEKDWNTERYQQKLAHLAQVLSSPHKKDLPEIIGLCEVENRSVLEDLLKEPKLAKSNYRIVHFESPDKRGIDNALLYDLNEFQIANDRPIPVEFEDKRKKTRDILLALIHI